MNEQIVKRYELVEIQTLGAQGSQLTIPILQQLASTDSQDIILRGLEFFSAQECPLTATGNTPIALADLQKVWLTLYVIDIDQALSIKRLPLVRLRPIFSAVDPATTTSFWSFETIGLENLQVMWDKSYFEKSDGWAGVGNLLMGVRYKKLAAGMWQQINQNKIPGW
jgi:hypothetical protein